MVEAIWPTSSVFCHSESASGAVLPLRTFIQETLRRSRSSYSTLQVALYYLILIKPRLPHRDFTREQSHDSAVLRALQCGRRMFLAALILASKYLQDRNFSARAWSKISGLAVAEINQNERAFLDAVRFELHITEPVYNRWTDVVMKLTPPPPPAPPSPACLSEHSQECDRFRKLILQLRPGLDNAGQVLPRRRRSAVALDDLPAEDFLMIPHKNADQASVSSPASTDASDDSTATAPTTTAAAIAASKQQQQLRRASAVIFVSPPYHPPAPALGILEPMAAPSPVPVPAAPALGLLPTPRLLPQNAGFGTPAVSAVSRMLSRRTAMEAAMAQVSRVNAAQVVDRWPGPVLASSPPAYPMLPRRSSLANSLSTASSPESMISDMSQLSRSSSISSTSGLASAPTSRLDAQARFRPLPAGMREDGRRAAAASRARGLRSQALPRRLSRDLHRSRWQRCERSGAGRRPGGRTSEDAASGWRQQPAWRWRCCSCSGASRCRRASDSFRREAQPARIGRDGQPAPGQRARSAPAGHGQERAALLARLGGAATCSCHVGSRESAAAARSSLSCRRQRR